MKKSNNKHDLDDEMRKEYDFKSMKGGVRGKYYKAYHSGHTVTIHKKDGTTVVQHFKLDEGAVVLEPDIRKHFRSAKAVNSALRRLIPSGSRKQRLRSAA